MHFNSVQIFIFSLLGMSLSPVMCQAERSQDLLQMEVAMRMIGHQLLLSVGDSTSLVLPIKKEGEQYRIRFDTELQFEPDQLNTIVSSVLEDAEFGSNFILAVEDCATCEIPYSYQVGGLYRHDMIPCKGRVLPMSCYNLLFTPLQDDILIEPLISNGTGVAHTNKDQFGQMTYPSLALLIALVAGMIVAFRKKRDRSKLDPNMITLGDYQFDKLNTELVIDQSRIELTSKEADLLILLYNAVNTALTRESILKGVWGDEGDYVGRTLDVFVSKLRKKLSADPKVKIVNIRGVGYKLVVR